MRRNVRGAGAALLDGNARLRYTLRRRRYLSPSLGLGGPVRILQVVHQFLPNYAAGTEIYTYKLSKELLGRGHEVHVFHRDFGRPETEFLEEDAELDGLILRRVVHNPPVPAGSFFLNPLIEKSFRSYVSRTSPDVIHFQHLDNLSPTLPAAAKELGKPTVMTLADFWLMCPARQLYDVEAERVCEGAEEGRRCARCPTLVAVLPAAPSMPGIPRRLKRLVPVRVKDAVKRRLGRSGPPDGGTWAADYAGLIGAGLEARLRGMMALDLIIAPSGFIRNLHIEYGIPSEKIVRSDYGFDLAGLSGVHKSPSEVVRFGYAGTLHAHKGVHVLVEAFRAARLGNAVLKIFGWGDPAYLNSLKAEARGPKIEFMGRYRPSDVAKVFSEMDVLVVPSLWYENSPLVIHEAFGTRTPTLVSDIGGMAELVADGKGGMTFRAGSVEDLAAKLRLLAGDESLRRSLADSAPKVKTIEENAEEMEEIYERLASRGAGDSEARPL